MNTSRFLGFFFAISLGFSMILIQVVWASNEPEFQYEIEPGVKAVDIVDASTGDPVVSPNVDFGTQIFSYEAHDASGTLGTAGASVRAYNPTGDDEFTVSIAPAGTFAEAEWSDGLTNSYPIQAAEADDGRLTINPSVATVSSDVGCGTVNVNKGSSAYFLPTTTESITLISANHADVNYCRYDVQGISMLQRVPAGQAATAYTLDMVLTIQ